MNVDQCGVVAITPFSFSKNEKPLRNMSEAVFFSGCREGSGGRSAGGGREGFSVELLQFFHLDEVVVVAADDSSDGSQDGAYGDEDHDSRAGDTKHLACPAEFQTHR